MLKKIIIKNFRSNIKTILYFLSVKRWRWRYSSRFLPCVSACFPESGMRWFRIFWTIPTGHPIIQVPAEQADFVRQGMSLRLQERSCLSSRRSLCFSP